MLSNMTELRIEYCCSNISAQDKTSKKAKHTVTSNNGGRESVTLAKDWRKSVVVQKPPANCPSGSQRVLSSTGLTDADVAVQLPANTGKGPAKNHTKVSQMVVIDLDDDQPGSQPVGSTPRSNYD